MNQSTLKIAYTSILLLSAFNIFAKNIDIQIQNDTSHLPELLRTNIARSALAMGVQEPLNINQNNTEVQISGNNNTSCIVKLSNDATPKMLGISCK